MSDKKTEYYKSCFVPNCDITTVTTPKKDFFDVPLNEERRQLWFEAAGCPDKKKKYECYCCEDHFDFKEDLENYMEYKMMGHRKLLKDNAIPRFFPTSNSVSIERGMTNCVNSCNDDRENKNPNVSINPLCNMLSPSKSVNSKQCQTEGEVEHKHVQTKPHMLTKNTQTNVENMRTSTRSIGVTCDIISNLS